jgi:HEPN domain-containing protein
MLRITREWVQKAEGDYDVVSLLLRSRKPSRYDPICFHAQQCVEKYLKARLVEAGIAFPKTHDLPAVLMLTAPVEPLWHVFMPELIALTKWAVLPRYPGMQAANVDARNAVSTCRRFRQVVRQSLGLPP